MTKFIAVLSGKGGVGKTTVAINLASALNNLGKDVVVLDGNLTTPTVGINLGLTNIPVSFHDVMSEKNNILNSVYLHSSGIRIIPGSINLNAISDVNLDNLENIFQQLQGLSEIVIIDLGAGLETETLNVLQYADEVLIVTNPELSAVTNALKAIKVAEELNVTVLGVVLNKLKENSELSIRNVEAFLERPILTAIPENEDITKAQHNKQTVFFNSPNSESAVNFKKLASYLIGQKYEQGLQVPKESWISNILKNFSLK